MSRKSDARAPARGGQAVRDPKHFVRNHSESIPFAAALGMRGVLAPLLLQLAF